MLRRFMHQRHFESRTPGWHRTKSLTPELRGAGGWTPKKHTKAQPRVPLSAGLGGGLEKSGSCSFALGFSLLENPTEISQLFFKNI